MIHLKGLYKAYDQLVVLSDTSLKVSDGEIVTILGPSGAGKSTLLKCIVGLESYSDGHIMIKGELQREYLLNNRIAYVPQKYSNFPWLSTLENIQLGYKSKGMKNIKDYQEVLNSLIKDIGLEGFSSYYPDTLSGGMQQRVAIGRALAQDTEILAMDEPFGALDYQTRQKLQLLIKGINRSYDKTILFVTHDIEEAIFLSDRMVVLSSIPSRVYKEYRIPETIRHSMCEEVRFKEAFIHLRKLVEKDLRAICQ